MRFTILMSVVLSALAFAQQPPTDPDTERPASRIAQLKVSSVKPGLTKRNEFTLRGTTHQKPLGGYQWKKESAVRMADAGEVRGVIRLKIGGTADGAVPLMKGVPSDFEVVEKFDVTELVGKRGEFELEVVDDSDAALFHTTVKL